MSILSSTTISPSIAPDQCVGAETSTKRGFVIASSSKWRQAIIQDFLSHKLGARFDSNTSLDDIVCTCYSPNIDEKAIRDTSPGQLVLKISRAKMEAVLAAGLGDPCSNNDFILTGDQVSVYCSPCHKAPPYLPSDALPISKETFLLSGDDYIKYCSANDLKSEIREKPNSAEECVGFLKSYENRYVQTVSALVLRHVPSQRQVEEIDINTVHFSNISDDVINNMIYKEDEGIEGKAPTGDCMNCSGGFMVEHPLLSKCVTHIDGSIQGVQGLNSVLLEDLLHRVCRP
eukprot:Tbor_TRINITY_DN5788_c1_g2::TRINITY_DN5788_c1_g2_i2::g.20623::m.20623/K06287/maf; septum formation protein